MTALGQHLPKGRDFSYSDAVSLCTFSYFGYCNQQTPRPIGLSQEIAKSRTGQNARQTPRRMGLSRKSANSGGTVFAQRLSHDFGQSQDRHLRRGVLSRQNTLFATLKYAKIAELSPSHLSKQKTCTMEAIIAENCIKLSQPHSSKTDEKTSK